jgi:hypothetical protein
MIQVSSLFMSLSPKQEQLFKQASKHIPGGVNSPVRAFNGVGGTPVLLKKPKVLISGMSMVSVMWIMLVHGAQ